ncbi:uncharacterized protein TNCV_2132381 [Trichonephila clavipes]|nr:uncharacterized protein TNCV_2132381 [Trichonephila clavipes]
MPEKGNTVERRSSERLLSGPATRRLLATDHVILNHGHVTWTTPELAPPLLTTTPHQREDVSALDRFNVHRCPTRWVFSGTGLELVTKQATVRYLYHSATAAEYFFEQCNAQQLFCVRPKVTEKPKIACDAEDCGFQMLNDDETVTSVQEYDPVDDETDEDEDNNESSKGPSNVC